MDDVSGGFPAVVFLDEQHGHERMLSLADS